MQSRWILHEGKPIFMSDFSNMGTDAFAVQQECEAIKIALTGEPPKSIIAIVNLDGTFVNDGIIKAFREMLPVTNKYIKRRAIIGVKGFRKHFISLVSMVVGDVNFSPFDSLDEALAWAVKP